MQRRDDNQYHSSHSGRPRSPQRREQPHYSGSQCDGSSGGEHTQADNNSTRPPINSYPYNQPHQQWHAVPRYWQCDNPEVHQVTNNPALNRAPMAFSLDLRSSRNQNSMSQHPPHYRPQPYSSRGNGAEFNSISRPKLTLARLEQLNDGDTPTGGFDIWRNERGRDGVWNSVGYVRTEGNGSRSGTGE